MALEDGAIVLKIAMVNVYYDPDLIGGVEWYIKDISSYLIRLGHEVEVYTTTGSAKTAFENLEGVSVKRFSTPVSIGYRTKVWPGVIRELRRSGCDIVHCYDYLQFQTLATMLSTSGPRTYRASVVTVFDVQHLVPRPTYKSIPVAVADHIASGLVSRGFDRVLVRAPDLVDSLVSIGFEREKMVVTQSGVRDEFLDPGDGEAFRERHRLHGNVVMYLGRINPTKGLDYLLDACRQVMAEHPDTEMVIIGPDEKGHKAHLRSQARSAGLDSNTIFLDPIYRLAEKRDALSACDAFVLPSGYEGTSQSVMQAMAQGRPVVTTRVGGLPYLIRDGFDGFLVPYASPEKLAHRINQLLDDATARRKMGKRARERARRQFLYSQLARQLVEIYQDVLSRPAS